jgi:hypothetical protein
MRLCVENRVEYDSGPKKDFWELIRDRLRAITGRDFRNVGQKVGLLVKQRHEQRRRETTGTERRRSELTIATDRWIDVIRDEQSRINAARRQKELRREEAVEAQRTRDSLLRSRSTRDRESDNDESETDDEASGEETLSTTSRPSRKRRRRGEEPLHSMATAIQGLASSWVASDERSSTEIVAVERKLDGVASRMDDILEALRTRARQASP